MALEVYSRTKDGAAKLSANFTVNEFACKDGSDPVFVDSDLIRILQAIRDRLQVPVSVTSGYRECSPWASPHPAAFGLAHIHMDPACGTPLFDRVAPDAAGVRQERFGAGGQRFHRDALRPDVRRAK